MRRESVIQRWFQRVALWVHRQRAVLFALLAYTALTLIVHYPVSLYPASILPGSPVDTYQHMWSLWWTRHALVDLHTLPSNLTHLYAPVGMDHPLLWVTPYVHLLSIPLQRVMGLIPTYNLLALLSFPLCGLTMYLLAYDRTRDRSAAFVAGLIFAFFPGKGIRLCGHYLQLPIYWFPLYVLYLFKLLRDPTVKNALWGGVLMALSSLIHTIHTAYFVLPVTALCLLYHLVYARRLVFRWSFIKALALMGGIAFVLVLPFYGPYLYSSFQKTQSYVYVGGDIAYSTDLLSFFIPADSHPLWRRVPAIRALARRLIPKGGNSAESMAFLGWLPLGLAMVGIVVARREARMWWLLSLGAAVLSLGPLLHFNGELVAFPWSSRYDYVPLPYIFLDRLPFYKWGRTPGRFNETVIFGLALLAALGTRWVMQQVQRRPVRRALLGLFAVVITFEYLAWWPIPSFTPPPASDFYRTLSGDSEEIVLTFPAFYRNPEDDFVHAAEHYDMYYQTIHQHKISGGYIWRWALYQKGLVRAFDELLLPARNLEIVDFPSDNDRAAVLSRYGVRYVVVHKPWPKQVLASGVRTEGLAYAGVGRHSDPVKQAAAAQFETWLGPPIFEDDVLWAFEVPEPSSAADAGEATMMHLGSGWSLVQFEGDEPWRWMGNSAELYVERMTEGYVRMSFQTSHAREGLLHLGVNGQRVQAFGTQQNLQTVTTQPFFLQAGRNRLLFFSAEHCLDPAKPCDVMQLARISLSPVSFEVDTPLEVAFEEGISLLRVSRDVVSATPGETVDLTLTWMATQTPSQNYRVFVHLIDETGQLVAQHDSEPDLGRHPTGRWRPGLKIRDVNPLTLPAELPPGTYAIWAGIYEPASGRLDVLRSSVPRRDGAVRIGTLEVLAKD